MCPEQRRPYRIRFRVRLGRKVLSIRGSSERSSGAELPGKTSSVRAKKSVSPSYQFWSRVSIRGKVIHQTESARRRRYSHFGMGLRFNTAPPRKANNTGPTIGLSSVSPLGNLVVAAGARKLKRCGYKRDGWSRQVSARDTYPPTPFPMERGRFFLKKWYTPG